MILLDTNVVSETLKPQASPLVVVWLDKQAPESLYLSTVTMAELLFGASALPHGKRQQQLQTRIEAIGDLFKNRILSFDLNAAQTYAQLAFLARSKGKGFPTPDGYIAAIAASKRMIVASRDTAPFAAVGLEVINPWVV